MVFARKLLKYGKHEKTQKDPIGEPIIAKLMILVPAVVSIVKSGDTGFVRNLSVYKFGEQ